MHFDALLSTPMIRDSASSLIVRKVVSGAIIFPANVEGIAIAGIMVIIFWSGKILPLDLLPFLLLYRDGVFGVLGRLFSAHSINFS